ncbi:facilitated trehalose transporter Tret1 [Lasioglossum baleicum]|uniref:facilitated trehalose transporter Tret1 n=1 Tax=Lasioglossum baleicum TaxID=434251 RepID=UPI003FCC43D9
MLKIFDKHEESDLVLRSRQVAACVCLLLCSFTAGISIGYSAVLLPQLRSNSTEGGFRDLSSEDLSWVASSVILSMLPGSCIGGYMFEMIGRKWSVLVLYPMTIVGWLVIALADGLASLIIGRMICGLAIGMGTPLVPVYISELSDPVLRGILLSLIAVQLTFGILVGHAIGFLFYWRTAAYIYAALCAINSMTCIASLESSTWLLNKGDTDRAIELWVYLRGCESLNEYLALEGSVTAARKFDNQSTLSDLKEALTSTHFLYPLGIVCAYLLIGQFNGSNVIVFYSVDMLTEMTGPGYADLGTLVADLVRLLFCIFACYLIKSYNRRTLTFVSGFVTASTLLLLTLVLYYEFGRPWCPGVLLVLTTLFINIGLEPLSWVLCGEMFPRKFRGLGSALSSSWNYVCLFLAVKFLPDMTDTLDVYGSFAVYGVITLFGTIFLYFTMPETKNQALQDVEKSFDRKMFRRKTVDAQFSGTLYF